MRTDQTYFLDWCLPVCLHLSDIRNPSFLQLETPHVPTPHGSSFRSRTGRTWTQNAAESHLGHAAARAPLVPQLGHRLGEVHEDAPKLRTGPAERELR